MCVDVEKVFLVDAMYAQCRMVDDGILSGELVIQLFQHYSSVPIYREGYNER